MLGVEDGGAAADDHAAAASKGNRMLYGQMLAHGGRPLHKVMHYVAAYERHFGRYVGQPATFLEIGAGNGGSAQMWKRWFGPRARIVVIDIDPVCEQFADEQVEVRIGDQSDTAFLQRLVDEFGIFDMILDDGSHVMDHLRVTFEFLYPRMAPNGVYVIEDAGTAYWSDYGGGHKRPGTIVEFFKDAIDQLNYVNLAKEHDVTRDPLLATTCCLTAWDSMLVFEKAPYINTTTQMIGDMARKIR